MRILIASDAWHPQINGVVRTYDHVIAEASVFGAEIVVLSPSDYRTVSLPLYPEIRLALPAPGKTRDIIQNGHFDYIHVATEGPVGLMAWCACRRLRRPFTTSYHTRFPEYAYELAGIPPALSRVFLRRFHNAGIGTMVATCSMKTELAARGFRRLLPWARGVDTFLFRPRAVRLFGSLKPVFLYAGRVSKEKNLDAFLSLDLPGQKVVVGDGPYLEVLRRRYPDVIYTGSRVGESLAQAYASADVFVFPSRTDTFGLVIIEALASGVPVAAFPVTGPIDIVTQGVSGYVDDDLQKAALMALELRRDDARENGLKFSWRRATSLFLNNIETAHRCAGVQANSRPARRMSSRRPAATRPLHSKSALPR